MQRGGIVVSDTTRRLLHGRFRLQTLKPLHIKDHDIESGGSQMPVYKLLGEAPGGDHDATQPHSGLIGRRSELQRMKRLWQLDLSGQQIGSASYRERVCRSVKMPVVAVSLKKKK